MTDEGPGGHPPPPAKCSQCDRYVPCPVHGGKPGQPDLPPGTE